MPACCRHDEEDIDFALGVDADCLIFDSRGGSTRATLEIYQNHIWLPWHGRLPTSAGFSRHDPTMWKRDVAYLTGVSYAGMVPLLFTRIDNLPLCTDENRLVTVQPSRKMPHGKRILVSATCARSFKRCEIVLMGFKPSRSATSRAAAPKAAAPKQPAPVAANSGKKAKSKAIKSVTDIEPLRETIRRAIVDALKRSHSLREAARALDMPYSSLRDKLYQLGIDVSERSDSRQRAEDVLTVQTPGAPAKSKRGTSKKSKKK